ncbi:MAG: transporter substrate-binding domain-containing protein [Rubrimonas sp.]
MPVFYMLRALALTILLAAPAGAEVLDRLAETGALRIGVSADQARPAWSREGAAAGYAAELCERVAVHIADQLGRAAIDTRRVEVEGPDVLRAVAEGHVDLYCGPISATLERRAMADFSIPIYVDAAAMLTRRGETVEFGALDGRRVALRAGATLEHSLPVAFERQSVSADVVAVSEHAEGLARLIGRDIDAYFADPSALLFLVASSGMAEDLAITPQILVVPPQALAMPRGDDAFRLHVDRALSRMYRLGEIAELFERHFAPSPMSDAMRAIMMIAPLQE